MSDCIFCKVIGGEVPSYTVYEDGQTKAFLDIMPSMPGHTMVVLKKHSDKIFGYTKDELGAIMDSVQKVAKALEKAFDTSVLTIGINHGEVAGVHHMHIHLIPRTSNDGGKVLQSLARQETDEQLESIKEKIIKNMK
jgi:histidine triad (HIT) family protein